MAVELSKVLDHIEAIRELDLEGVEPTSHVVDVVNALRADVPEPSLDRDVALGAGTRADRRRIRRAEPGCVRRMSAELLDLSARRCGRRDSCRRGRCRRAVRALPLARRGRRAERVHWVADAAPSARVPADAPLAGVPLAVKDLFCTEGVPSQAGSKILEGYRPPYTATVVRQLAEAGAPLLGKTNQDEFAMGSSNENSAFGPVLNPWDTDPRPRRIFRWQRRGGRGGPRALGARHRHRWLDPSAGRVLGDRRAEADLWRVLALRDDRVRLLAGPGGAADTGRDRQRAAAPPHGRSGRPRLDLAGVPGGDQPALARRPQGCPARRARGAARRREAASNRACVRSFDAALVDAEKLGATRRRHAGCRTPRTRCRPTTSSPRRRPQRTWRASTACATACGSAVTPT